MVKINVYREFIMFHIFTDYITDETMELKYAFLC